jgi:hypothetical protein
MLTEYKIKNILDVPMHFADLPNGQVAIFDIPHVVAIRKLYGKKFNNKIIYLSPSRFVIRRTEL